VALHGCDESGEIFSDTTGFSTLADEYGFIVIYPSSPRPDGCFDTSSPAALRRGGGSDPVSIMSMITYTERGYHADPRRVYVTGASSGGGMTSVMLGDYPDVFAGGAIFMGVPFGCDVACTSIPASLTPREWGDIARNADPGYHGPRPRVQIWHGTADPNVLYANFGEEIKQWTNVLGVSQVPLVTDHPRPGWTRTVYGTGNDIQVEAYSIQGAGHELPEIGMEAYVIQFFGLDHG
jgi:poly(hydroxyalkanoate) depolymerase family esterase